MVGDFYLCGCVSVCSFALDGFGGTLVSYTNPCTITQSGATTSNIITISGDNIKVTIKNLNIDRSNSWDMPSPIGIQSGSCNLTLTGTNTLKSGWEYAALGVEIGASLTLAEQEACMQQGAKWLPA